MKIVLLTSRTCHCANVEQALRTIGFAFEQYDVEDRPELVQRFGVRHFPSLILDERRVIPIDENNATQIKQLLTADNSSF